MSERDLWALVTVIGMVGVSVVTRTPPEPWRRIRRAWNG